MHAEILSPRAALRLAVMALATLAGATGAPSSPNPGKGDASVSTSLTPDGGRIVVEAHGVPPPAPLFFSAEADETALLGLAEITGEIHLSLRVLQGRPEMLTIGLSGDGDVVEVSGA